jgi:hypothetical protein
LLVALSRVEEVVVERTAVALLCSTMLVAGCSSVSVDCTPLVSDGARCVCPEGTFQVDDWVCELPDGGFIERPGRPDGGFADASVDAAVADSGADVGIDAGEIIDAGTDTGEFDSGTDAGVDWAVDAGVDAGFDAGPPPQPDLLISCGTPAAIVGSGDEVEVSYEVANLGDATAANIDIALEGTWGTSVLLDSQRVLTLAPSGTREGTLRFVAPNTVGGGANTFRCRVDPANSITERNEGNNDSNRSFTATGAPDVVVSGVIPSPIRNSTTVRFVAENRGRVRGSGFQWIFEGQIVGGARFTMDEDVLPDIEAGGRRFIDAQGAVPPPGGSGQARFYAGVSFDSDVGNNGVVRDAVSFQP